ncbi:MAG: sporulation transcriptional regulator SpoIIID [Clostridiales bacterium]|nr:sporulation transcriptional regulator SpoIIID [Clostridiales bacterium]HOC08665.1 sporulation transcriptional regulator SpoIIID [Bacillota bacterium]HZX46386.1 sporulation transcriptional regulator SpoIIID [Clostridia bacterium]NLZ91293.1 sporulation transcriptional regulator SpoIIID [Clostridiales bacterium]HQA47039.1 sporulation transcriptional regulator SpoIIID [Bacillota bacterium]
MKDYIHERVIAAAKYVLDTKSTVRETAKVFGVSKSTIHKDITDRLPRINPSLAEEVKRVLAYNKAERHIRGGKATREKYIKAQGKNAIPS